MGVILLVFLPGYLAYNWTKLFYTRDNLSS